MIVTDSICFITLAFALKIKAVISLTLVLCLE